MPQAGLLLQLDGSRHDWLEGRGPWLTLVGAVDDATGAIVAATFRDAEDSAGYLEILRATVRRHGLPAAVYRDRHGAFEHAEPLPAPELRLADGRLRTQVGRALAELGIRSITAGSAQAKGRVERTWGTCQDRLVTELRLARATDRASANRVLARFLPRYNRRFAIAPADLDPAWRPLPADVELDAVLAFRYRRVVANDHTIRIGGMVLDLPRMPGGRGCYQATTVQLAPGTCSARVYGSSGLASAPAARQVRPGAGRPVGGPGRRHGVTDVSAGRSRPHTGRGRVVRNSCARDPRLVRLGRAHGFGHTRPGSTRSAPSSSPPPS